MKKLKYHHHLLALMLFQTCMTFFQLNIAEDILKNLCSKEEKKKVIQVWNDMRASK